MKDEKEAYERRERQEAQAQAQAQAQAEAPASLTQDTSSEGGATDAGADAGADAADDDKAIAMQEYPRQSLVPFAGNDATEVRVEPGSFVRADVAASASASASAGNEDAAPRGDEILHRKSSNILLSANPTMVAELTNLLGKSQNPGSAGQNDRNVRVKESQKSSASSPEPGQKLTCTGVPKKKAMKFGAKDRLRACVLCVPSRQQHLGASKKSFRGSAGSTRYAVTDEVSGSVPKTPKTPQQRPKADPDVLSRTQSKFLKAMLDEIRSPKSQSPLRSAGPRPGGLGGLGAATPMGLLDAIKMKKLRPSGSGRSVSRSGCSGDGVDSAAPKGSPKGSPKGFLAELASAAVRKSSCAGESK
jgi:hypothetical protein